MPVGAFGRDRGLPTDSAIRSRRRKTLLPRASSTEENRASSLTASRPAKGPAVDTHGKENSPDPLELVALRGNEGLNNRLREALAMVAQIAQRLQGRCHHRPSGGLPQAPGPRVAKDLADRPMATLHLGHRMYYQINPPRFSFPRS
jgi:hypothetical protein